MMFKGWTAAVSAAVLLLLAPSGGQAATEANFLAKTTADVVALCDPHGNTALDNAGVNFCSGFLQGVVLTEQEHEANPHSRQFFCLPDPAPTRNEVMGAFVAWARTSPDRMNLSAVDGLISFLGERYACPKHR